MNISPSAQAEFDGLPKEMKRRMAAAFERLSQWPQLSGAKPMTGEFVGSYRLRTGDYRVVFRVRGAQLTVIRIGHRKDVYD